MPSEKQDKTKNSRLTNANRRQANKSAKNEYKQEKTSTRKFKKANKETFKQQAKQMNIEIDKINQIIKKQGYYDGPEMTDHYEKRIKKVNYKQLMKQNENVLIKPHNPINKVPLFVRLHLFFQRIKEKILNFFANLTNRQTKYSQSDFNHNAMPNPTAGLKTENIDENNIEKSSPTIQLGDNSEIFQQQSRKNIDINKEFQHWLTENKINNIAPSEVVFDFIKSAISEGFIADEKGVSDILTYAFENACEYDAEQNKLTMFFSVKEPKGIAAFSVDGTGNISCPTNFIYKEQEYTNVVNDNTVSKIPPKVQFIADSLENTSDLLYNMVNETQYSRTSLEQVREYVDKTELTQYIPYIEAVENTLNDQNAIKALNEFIVKTSFIEGLSPKETIDLAFIKPALAMAQMANPSQYKEIFPFVENNIIKGYSLDTSFKLGELLLRKDEDGKLLQSQENREKITSHIEGLEKAGFDSKDIINIVSLYNEKQNPEVIALSIGTINYELANGIQTADISLSSDFSEINIEEITSKITEEMSTFMYDDIQNDIENETLKTMINVYIHTLSPQTLNEVANNLDESIRGPFKKIAGLQQDISDIVLNDNEHSMANNNTEFENYSGDNNFTIETDSPEEDITI